MIEKLTPEQEAAKPKYVEKWQKIGLCCDPVDRARMHEIIQYLYDKVLKKPKPETKLWPSPAAAWKEICRIVGKKISFVWPFIDGHYSAGFFAFYDFFNKECGMTYNEHWEWYKTTSELGPVFPFDNICLVSDRPEALKLNGDRIHCENGPAVRYRDGFEVYGLNGVRVPKWIVMTPWDQLDCREMVKIENAEVRREFVRKVGTERICLDLGAQCVDAQGDYELLMLNIGDSRRRPYLKMKNPSIGTYHIEGVHPDCDTVEKALRFRNGTDEKPVVLT